MIGKLIITAVNSTIGTIKAGWKYIYRKENISKLNIIKGTLLVGYTSLIIINPQLAIMYHWVLCKYGVRYIGIPLFNYFILL